MIPLLGTIGLLEAVLIAFVLILLFASSRMAGILRGLGAGIHEFKKGIREGSGSGQPPASPRG
ncbi:MAG: twin-arginine translocase TatA/TatE family subunit [Planctomycetota bacterium]